MTFDESRTYTGKKFTSNIKNIMCVALKMLSIRVKMQRYIENLEINFYQLLAFFDRLPHVE